MSDSMLDIVIIGGGPIGYVTALYIYLFMKRNVSIIDYNHDKEPTCIMSSWKQDVDDSWFGKYCNENNIKYYSHVWNNVLVKYSTDPSDKSIIDMGYITYDEKVIKNHIRERLGCDDNNQFIDGSVIRVIDNVVHYVTDNVTKTLNARHIIDCSGHYTGFTDFNHGFSRNWQSFIGEVIVKPNHGIDTDTAIFLDLSMELSESDAQIPTFVYVLPFDEDKVLFEETIMIHPTTGHRDYIMRRLGLRKGGYGLSGYPIEFVEDMALPIGGNKSKIRPRKPHPDIVTGQTIGNVSSLGGADRDIHPATGFMLQYTINNIPYNVGKILSGPDSGSYIHDLSERLKYNMMAIGSIMIMTLCSLEDYRDFFRAFFSIDSKHWYRFMTRRGNFLDLMIVMTIFFIKLPLTLKIHCVKHFILNIGILFDIGGL